MTFDSISKKSKESNVPRGGKRDGAGRKKGGANKRTSVIALCAAVEGITPIEVMLRVMRMYFEAEEYDRAAAIARDAAPYTTPRLAAVACKNVLDEPPNFSFLIETVDEHGSIIPVPAPTPVASGANGLPHEQGAL